MPVAPYRTTKYRDWNRDRMRRYRREQDGVRCGGCSRLLTTPVPGWSRTCAVCQKRQFWLYGPVRTVRARAAADARDYAMLGRAPDDRYWQEAEERAWENGRKRLRLMQMIDAAGGWDLYRVKLASGL